PAVVPCGDFNLDFHYVEDVSDAFLRALRLRSGKGCAYLTHGDYRPVAEAFDFVRKLLPDADMTLEPGLPDGSSQSWSWRFDAGRAEADLGVRSRFRMEDGVYRTVNQYRLLAGLPPVPQPETLSADLP